MRCRVVLLLVLSFLLICLFSCGDSNNQYTPSLIFEESQGGYMVTGISSDDSEIIIPKTYRNKSVQIGEAAFKNCEQLENVEINCFVIGKNAFENCINIKSITIGKDVLFIGESAFSNTEKLTQINYFAENIEDIHGGTFENAGINGDGIKLTIGNNVKSFPGWFFSNCGNLYLKNVVFEDNSKCSYIGPYAFYSCENLTSIVIPKNVQYIGVHCFSGCEKLKTVSFENREADWKIHKYENTEEYIFIINSDTIKNETEIAKKLVSEYNSYDWRQ